MCVLPTFFEDQVYLSSCHYERLRDQNTKPPSRVKLIHTPLGGIGKTGT